MDEFDRPRRDQDSANEAAGGAALRTPSSTGGSSSAEIPGSDAATEVPLRESSDSDAPTLIHLARVSPSDSPTLVDAISRSAGRRNSPRGQDLSGAQPVLEPGAVLAGRYEIEQTLGEGGMGAVYKAKDLAVDRLVALKVIRPDLARNSAIIDRFKQELLLSQRVTHRNVIRIYDLGEGDGVKFITMEYIEGKDLRNLIRERRKLPPVEAIEIMEQVCLALDAAHNVGVIHRDLKPQNIMIDQTGRVLVMDFGLARTLEGDGMTQSGALVGTMEYMSPEQALAKPLDQRSDLFSAGLIFYELLTGEMPFHADSALASLIRRTQERAVPISDFDASIPANLTAIVSKCLERDASLRYRSAKELLADLETWQGATAAATLRFGDVGRWAPSAWPWITLVAVVLVLGGVGFRYRDQLLASKPRLTAAVKPEVSLAILPFRNASGDASLDWLGPSLAEMLSTDVGQSAHLSTISTDRLHQILKDLQITTDVPIDPSNLRRIAEFSSADTIVWGQYAKFGEQIRIDATLQDLKHDRRTALKIDFASEKEVPGGIDRLAESIRQNLGMSVDVVKELKASSFQPTSQSLPALRDYNEGVGFLRDGKSLEAQAKLEAATKEDPTFALAYSKLAQTYAALGYDVQAEQSAEKAVEFSENLPPAERYLIAAIRAQVANNYPAAIIAYENLAKASPDNSDVQSALGRLYEDTGDFAKAGEHYQKLLSSNPKDLNAIVATGRLAIKRGAAQESLDPLNRALSLSVQFGNDAQRSTSLHLLGVAYRMLNRPEDALRNFQEALAIRRRIGDKRGIAFSLNEMAVVEVSLGKPKDALDHYQEALQVRREIGDKRGLAETLLDLGNFYDDRGDHDQGLKMYKEALQLERDLGNEGLQAICLNNIGAVYYEKAQYEDARTYYEQALQLREKSKVPQDIVESIHNLAETSVRMGRYDQAITEYMRALDLRRSMNDTRGAAIESYTVGVMFDYQGRYGAAINSEQDGLKTFQALQDKTTWMADIASGYGEALILAGRGQEAKPYLEEALNLARVLKSDGLLAQSLTFQGDVAYYSGDVKSASGFYQQALQAATHSKEPDRILTAKVKLAKVAVDSGHASQAMASLRQLMKEADEQGVAHISVECSIWLAQAMIQGHENVRAQQELEGALLRSDKLGLKPLSARAHYLLATSLRATGNRADAQLHFRQVQQLLEGMSKEAGAEKIMQRSDFKSMYDEATRPANL